MIDLLKIGAFLTFALAAGTIAFQLARVRPVAAAELGLRGLRRQRALRTGSYRIIEPLIRLVAAWMAYLPIDGLRRRAARQLRLSGEFLGLTPDELIALTLCSGLGFGGLSALAVAILPLPAAAVPLFVALGLAIPYSRIGEVTRQRWGDIERGLPGVIDLAALCMGAGQDFPGALRQVVSTSPTPDDPLTEELTRILQELELGKTRRRALEAFAERVPLPIVRDFVGAVVQSEVKGNPLAQVLRIQATVLRLRRSTALEEAASRSALMMMGPLVLMMLSVLAILLGPLIVNISQTQL